MACEVGGKCRELGRAQRKKFERWKCLKKFIEGGRERRGRERKGRRGRYGKK